LRSGIHQQKAEGVTPDIYFKIPAIESAHLKQEAFTCVGDVKTISRCKSYYGWSRPSDEGIKDPIHLSKAAKPMEKKEWILLENMQQTLNWSITFGGEFLRILMKLVISRGD